MTIIFHKSHLSSKVNPLYFYLWWRQIGYHSMASRRISLILFERTLASILWRPETRLSGRKSWVKEASSFFGIKVKKAELIPLGSCHFDRILRTEEVIIYDFPTTFLVKWHGKTIWARCFSHARPKTECPFAGFSEIAFPSHFSNHAVAKRLFWIECND